MTKLVKGIAAFIFFFSIPFLVCHAVTWDEVTKVELNQPNHNIASSSFRVQNGEAIKVVVQNQCPYYIDCWVTSNASSQALCMINSSGFQSEEKILEGLPPGEYVVHLDSSGMTHDCIAVARVYRSHH